MSYSMKLSIFIVLLIIFLVVGISTISPEEKVSFVLGGESFSKVIPEDPDERKQLILDLAQLISMYDETYGSTEQSVLTKLKDFSLEIEDTKKLINKFIDKVDKWEPEDFDYENIRNEINELADISTTPYRIGLGAVGIVNSLDLQNQYGVGINAHFQYKQFYMIGLFGLIGNQTTFNSITTIGFGVFIN